MNDLIVDGNSLWARCWYAKGEDARGALDLYIQTVLQFLDHRNGRLRFPIHRTLFAWDGHHKTEKNREKKPAKYEETRRYLKQTLVDFFGVVNVLDPDYEADDVVATAAFNSKAKTAVVVSGDKDLMQLQGGNVLYYCLNTKALLTGRLICQKFGIKRPSQVAIAQAILGDRSDGIKGVPKWGPKKLAKIFVAVTERMSFAEALQAVQAQIPEHLMGDFLESLDKTLLHTELEGVPEPAPLKFCDTADVEDEGFEQIAQTYEDVAMLYDDRDAILNQMLKDSVAAGRHRTDG